MRKIFFTQVVMAVIVLNISVSCCFSSTDVGDAMKLLPESTDFVIKFSSTKSFYEYLSITDKSLLGQPIEDINEIKENFGFNPFDLKELESSGLDGSKPFGIAVSDFKIVYGSDTPDMNFILFLPVKDVKKAVAKIKELIEEDNPDADFKKKGEVWSWKFDLDSSELEDLQDEASGKDESTSEDNTPQPGDTTQTREIEAEKANPEPEPVEAETPPVLTYMINKGGYLFIGANPAADARQFFENFGKQGKKLVDATVFTNVIKKVNPSNDIFLYANLGRIFNSNIDAMRYLNPAISQTLDTTVTKGKDADKNRNAPPDSSYSKSFNYLKYYQGAGISADLKNPDLKANFVLNVAEKSALLNVFKGVSPKRDILLGLKDNPLMLIGFVENFQAYWQMVHDSLDKDTLNAMKQQFATVKTDYDIDVEKDVIQNIGNNLGIGIYDAMSINMANVNTLLSVEFKDPAKIKAVMEKGIAKLPPEQQSMINRVPINGSEVFMVPAGPFQVYAGFIGNDLVITLGKPMFEKAMSAELENGFIKTVKDKQLQISLQKDTSLFFFDVGEAMYAVKNFAPMLLSVSPESQLIMMPEFQKIVEPFDYISAFSRIDGDSMVGEFLFKTEFKKPFFQGIKDVSNQIEALSMTIKK